MFSNSTAASPGPRSSRISFAMTPATETQSQALTKGFPMIRHAILLACMCAAWLAMGQEETHQQFLVYDVVGRVEGVGAIYAGDELAPGGETKNSWKGKLLFDAGSGLGAIVWRTTLRGEKVQQQISLDLAALYFDVFSTPGQNRNVLTLAAAGDMANFPDPSSVSVLAFLGSTASNQTINRLPVPAITRGVSSKLTGDIWVLSKTTTSYSMSKIKARFSLTDTRYANEVLGDYNHDGFIDLNDVIDYWQDLYRPDWRPINE
jgi:hypothetical protein